MNAVQQENVINKIKEYIKSNNLTQLQFAELAKVPPATLSRILSGAQVLTLKMANKLAEAMNTSLYDLTEMEYSSINNQVRGYLEYNGEIKRIDCLNDVKAFLKKYDNEIGSLDKRVKEDKAQDRKNEKIAKKNVITEWNIVLDRIDRYDCSQEDIWAFRKTDDKREDVVIALGNMCAGFEYNLNGYHFYGSEQAYICGMFSNNDDRHIKIQQALIDETNGYASKKQIRQKNEVLKRDDWETFNIEWMKYVVWNKVKGNNAFRELLLKVPTNAHIVENSTHQKGKTSAIWGAKNQELEDARDRAVKYALMKNKVKGTDKKELEMKTRNSLNYIGVYEGKNLMGKILKLCQLAILEGKELDIDYDLLRSKNIYLLGELQAF